jgi:8-hydroxy-5-deazaflavin:NADPH oxidoreductase
MKFAIIGSGNVGSAIAHAVTNAGHDAVVAAPSEQDLRTLADEVPIATTTSNRDAVNGADAVVLAVPFGAVNDIVTGLRDELADKIVIDVTNPVAPDLSGLTTDGTSGPELVARAAPKARVVKAFNTVFAANQATATVDGTQLDGFVAGDDTDAKQTVMSLLAKIGFRPVDVGGLSVARYLEGMGYINIALNARNDGSWQSGWKLVGPLS